MLDARKSRKLVELTTRALSINKELLSDEEKFIEATINKAEVLLLKFLSNKIVNLARKERLYIGAAHSLLQSMKYYE